jgi:hypothetical protein
MTKKIKSGTLTVPAGIPSVSGGQSRALDFVTALQQGDPAALAALATAGVKPGDYDTVAAGKTVKGSEEPSWADEFVASTYGWAKAFGMNAHGAKIAESYMEAYRADMRKTHRFVLDNDFTRLATEISSTLPPQKLLARLQYASLPYENTWIEFDLPTKVHTMRRIHNLPPFIEGVGRKMGVLLQRLSDTECVMSMVVEAHGMSILVPTIVCYYLSLREMKFDGAAGHSVGCRPFHHVAREALDHKAAEAFMAMGRASIWGYAETGVSTVLERPSDLTKLRLPSYLLRHGDIGLSREWFAVTNALYKKSYPASPVLAELMNSELGEFAGMGRWMVTVLAMLNEVPVYTDYQHPQGRIRIGLTAKRKYMDYHKVTLRLPKTEPIKWVEKHLRNSRWRNKKHPVRAHWRTYLEEPHCTSDDHEWVYDHEEGYRLCGKCMGFGRFIHEHTRGDESLGWVRSDYVIKKEPDA